MKTPTSAATQRWRTCAEVSSVRAGTSVPPISGQSGNTFQVPVAVTAEPNKSKANVAVAVNAARSVKRWLPPRLGRLSGYAARTVTNTSSPTNTIAAARCAVTDSPLLPRRTVSRPSQAWNPTSPTAPNDGQRSDRRSRRARNARIARPRISNPMIAARVRCVHSIHAFESPSGGSSWP
jgi:hypothetical protein